MPIGTCRSDGCDEPRRVRRGTVEPLCEDCYRAACRRVAAQLAAEDDPRAARRRYRQINLTPQPARPPRSAPQPSARTHGQEASAPSRRSRERPRLISDGLLEEARRRHHDEHRPLGQIAGELLEHTGYANAHSATAALRRHFKQRGWTLIVGRSAA